MNQARRLTAAGLLSVALVALAGCGDDQARSKPLHAPANFDPTMAGFVACSRLIVEGDVVSVTDGRPGRMLTTLAVTDWVKPATGARQAKIDTVDMAGQGVYQRWVPGTHLFLVVDVDPSALPEWQWPKEDVAAIREAVSPAEKLSCPYGP